MILAADLGSGRLRVALVDGDGAILRLESTVLARHAPQPGWSEAAPDLWWEAFMACVARLAAVEPAAFGVIRAVAICGMTRSQVVIGADGTVLGPAILWSDTRAGVHLDSLLAILPADHPERSGINVFHPLARLWWRQREGLSPGVVIEPKDYLNFRLTGRLASDHVSMARLAAAAAPGPDGRSLLAAAGVDPAVLPGLIDPLDVVGIVRAGLSLGGVPVLAMSHDTWASVVGLGALRPGFAYNISGTTDVIGVLHAAPSVPAEGLMHVHWTGGLDQLGGPSQAGGDSLLWLMALLGEDALGPALDRMARQTPDPAPLLFLPYLSGERTPYWDPDLRAAFVGLNRRHGAPDLLRAVMEGVAFLNRVVLARAREAGGMALSELRLGGGGAASAVWCQIKADVLGLRVVVPRGLEHGLIGAAIAAMTRLGDFASLSAAQAQIVRADLVYAPDPARQAHYSRLYAVFREAEAALRPISHRLANWQAS